MKFLVRKSVSESVDLLTRGFGFTRAEIEDNVQVRNPSESGFDVRYGDGGGGPCEGKGLGYTAVDTPSGPNLVPNSGTITTYSEGRAITLTFKIDAADFFAVSGTNSDTDNRKLWLQELRGKDVFKLGAGDDRFELMSGNDKGYGRAGSDRIHAGAGNDKLYGGEGADFLYGTLQTTSSGAGPAATSSSTPPGKAASTSSRTSTPSTTRSWST
ncbi:hypothetical protein [uncultured Albimonas sp.]|uniref:calcium-binding protein n=1 Tax=uncultured Albimonas sp. TaxID=1331701 RepID=UPI0030EC4FB8|tara:strand:- start:1882 stop:2520 length:639 start_codon:yes stop_codon:yes gene_type:complete